MDYKLNLDWQSFLDSHWQKRPLLIKQGFTRFIDPISPDELAGLAMEDEVDSRLVSHKDGNWQVGHGPFESYDHLGEENWSILVQAVDHWHHPSSALMKPFRVLSDWRMDDLMISYSVPGGGVGPHLDQYDVFIIQGEGRRQWRVGEKIPMKQHSPHPDLLQVHPFDAIIDEEMEPGDILYIPPGFPHEGYAIEPSLNYSVGFRAPNTRELISSFADHLISNNLGSYRYSDPDLSFRDNPAEILQGEQIKLREMMVSLIDDPELFRKWLGEYISQSRHELDVAPPEPPYEQEEIYELLKTQKETLYKLNGLRALRVGDQFYVNGECLETECYEAADSLCRFDSVNSETLGDAIDDVNFIPLITALVNNGYWYFED